jgi:hypothetical protein
VWLYTKNNNPQTGFTLDSEIPAILYHLAFTLNELGRTLAAKL